MVEKPEKLKRPDIRAKQYKVKPLTFGDRNAIMDETTVMDDKGRMRILTGTQRRLTIKHGVLKPDGKELTDEEIEKLDEPLGIELYRLVLKESRIPLGI